MWKICYRLTLLTEHGKIVGMKLVAELLNKLGNKREAGKTLAEYKEELLFKEGREQIKRLLQVGLRMPVQAL